MNSAAAGSGENVQRSLGYRVRMEGRGWITSEPFGGILGGRNGDLYVRAKFLDHLAVRSEYTHVVRAGGSGNPRGKRDIAADDLLEIQLER